MSVYLARRLLLLIPTLVGLSIAVFIVLRLLPGDAVTARLAQSGVFTLEEQQRVTHQLGLDQPIYVQYVKWVGHALQGDFGRSFRTGRPAAQGFWSALAVTVELAAAGLVVTLLIGIPAGVIAAIWRNTPIDHLVRIVAILGLSVPNFFLATLGVILLSEKFGYLPPVTVGFLSPLHHPWGNVQQIWLPALLLGFTAAAGVMRLTRSALLDVLGEDYIRTAWAKGLPGRAVIWQHAGRNALLPVITLLGTQIALTLGGTVILESIFGLPGIGRLTLGGIQDRDFPVIQMAVMVYGILLVSINLAVDLSYSFLDPRLRV